MQTRNGNDCLLKGLAPDWRADVRWPLHSLIAISMLLAAAALVGPAQAHWCHQGRARTIVERTICAYPSLFNKDRELNDLYKQLGGRSNIRLRTDQVNWLKSRNACADVGCLRRHYDERIRVLREMRYGPATTIVPPSAPPPAVVTPDPFPPVHTPRVPDQWPGSITTSPPTEEPPVPDLGEPEGLGELD